MVVSSRYSPPAGTAGKVRRQVPSEGISHSVQGITDSPVLSSATRALTVAFAGGTSEKASGSS